MGLRLALLLTALAAAASAVWSQPDKRQRFSSGVHIVYTDVTVLDRNRQPVRGLAAEDFEVLENGRIQRVVSIEEVHVPPATSSTGWADLIRSDVSRNRDISDQRLIVILLDSNLPFDVAFLNAAKSISRSIVHRLGPRDLAAVVFTNVSTGAQEFTSDKSRLLNAIDRFTWRMGRGTTFGAIARLSELLARLPQQRKSIIVVSSDVGWRAASARDSREQPIEDALEDVVERDVAARPLFIRAHQGLVSVYCVDPGGLDGLEGYFLKEAQSKRRTPDYIDAHRRAQPRREAAMALSAQTGAFAVVNTNDFTPGIEQILTETGSYYMLAYEPDRPARAGEYRRVQIRVKHPDVSVRTRRGYFGDDETQWSAGTQHASRSHPAIPQRAVALELDTSVVAGPRDAEVAIVLRVLPSAVTRTSDEWTVEYGLYDTEGTLKASRNEVARIPADHREAAEGFELLGRLPGKAGRFQLRATLRNREGVTGAVYGDVEIPSFTQQRLIMSDIMVRVTPALRSGPSGAFSGLLPFAPTTVRAFDAGALVTALARVYAAPRDIPVSIDVRVVSATGEVVSRHSILLAAERFQSKGPADVSIQVPTAGIPAGSYLLQIEASLGNARAARQLRFEIH